MVKVLNIILVCFFVQGLFGCAGYKLDQKGHLFSKYQIKQLKVPLFINRTIFPDISANFTNEVIKKLHNFRGLSVNGGEPTAAGEDVLIGVLSSAPLEKSVMIPLIRTFTGNSRSLQDAIGGRPDFYLTSQYQVRLSLDIILIKNPLLNGKTQGSEPKVLFHHSMPVEFKVVNNIAAVNGSDSLGVTNYTNNRGFFDYEISKTAKNVAEILENLIAL